MAWRFSFSVLLLHLPFTSNLSRSGKEDDRIRETQNEKKNFPFFALARDRPSPSHTHRCSPTAKEVVQWHGSPDKKKRTDSDGDLSVTQRVRQEPQLECRRLWISCFLRAGVLYATTSRESGSSACKTSSLYKKKNSACYGLHGRHERPVSLIFLYYSLFFFFWSRHLA